MELREYIVSETGQLFSKYGFKSVTMNDIATHLGMSKRTIYQHFEDKNELVNILVEEKLEVYDSELKAYTKEGKNAVHEVYLGLNHLNEWINALYAKLFYDLKKYHQGAWLKFKNFKEKCLAGWIANNLKRGIKEGVYRKELNIPIITQLRLDQGNIIFFQNEEYTNYKHTITEVMIEITNHYMYGICNQKGKVFLEHYNKQLINADHKS